MIAAAIGLVMLAPFIFQLPTNNSAKFGFCLCASAQAAPLGEAITARPMVDRFDFVGNAILEFIADLERDPSKGSDETKPIAVDKTDEPSAHKTIRRQDTFAGPDSNREATSLKSPQVAGWNEDENAQIEDPATDAGLQAATGPAPPLRKSEIVEPDEQSAEQALPKVKVSQNVRSRRYHRRSASRSTAPTRDMYGNTRNWKYRALFPE